MAVKLIASDYDGTLRRFHKVARYDRSRLKKWRESGRLFGVVTGRGVDFIRTIKDDNVGCDFLILYNGALVTDCDGVPIKEWKIPREDFIELEKFFENYPDAEAFDRADERDSYHQYYARFKKSERSLEVADEVNRLYGEKVTAFVNGNHINITVNGASKADGVSFILSYYGLGENECAVVGDDYNDMGMLKAHNGWAMINGKKSVKQVAKHIALSVGNLASILMKE